MSARLVAFALAASWALSACTGISPPAVASTSKLHLAFQHVAWHEGAFGPYAAWAVSAGKPLPLGRFLLSPMGGAPTTLGGDPITEWTAPVAAAAIDEILVTQEPPGALSDTPSRQIFLRGMVKGGHAELRPPVEAERFAGKTCTYILDNPATEKDLADDNGLWFARLIGKTYTPGLDVDPAPAGFAYSAWVVWNNVALRVGKFSQARENDDFYGYSGLTSTSLPVNFPGPPMPGEDFNTHLPAGVPAHPDLAGAVVIVALEPASLAGEDAYPSPLHLFRGQIPLTAAARTNYTLENVAAASWPSGTAAIE